MKKLKIVYNDGSSIKYKIKEKVDWTSKVDWTFTKIKSAIIQKYPLNKHEPVDIIKTYNRKDIADFTHYRKLDFIKYLI